MPDLLGRHHGPSSQAMIRHDPTMHPCERPKLSIGGLMQKNMVQIMVDGWKFEPQQFFYEVIIDGLMVQMMVKRGSLMVMFRQFAIFLAVMVHDGE